ncbi:MAG: hypothetical protein ACLFVJ_10390 [Persicimonas sp.]
MDAFFGIVVAAIFVALITVMIVMGVRYLRADNTGKPGGKELPSSKDRTQDRGKELERDRETRRKMRGEG